MAASYKDGSNVGQGDVFNGWLPVIGNIIGIIVQVINTTQARCIYTPANAGTGPAEWRWETLNTNTFTKLK